MQIKIKTKNGERVVNLELSKLRVFKRLSELERRVESIEKHWEEKRQTRGVADIAPCREPEERVEAAESYTDSDFMLEYLEGETAAKEARAARRAVSEEKKKERAKGSDAR